MQTLIVDATPAVSTIILVDPDRLIELGHRMKQHAMDFAMLGESVTAPLTDRITLLYEPTREYTKPAHMLGAPAILQMGEAVIP